jgi:Domain of unknown function (DUF5615)
MIARLYSNENLPVPVVTALRMSGHEALTSLDAGKANDAIPDDEVLRFANADQRAVITQPGSRRHHRLHRGHGFSGSRRPHPESTACYGLAPRPVA